VASFSFCGSAARAVPVCGGAVLVVGRFGAFPPCLLFSSAVVRSLPFPSFPVGCWAPAFVAAGLPVPPFVVRVPLLGRVPVPLAAGWRVRSLPRFVAAVVA
jgi:hypothetical protein